MISEQKKQEFVTQISLLSDDQAESLEKYILELSGAQSDQPEGGKKYLIFECREQVYGIDISQIVQIIEFSDIIQLPNSASFVKGVVNIRENMVPIIDLGTQLGKPEAVCSKRACIIIVTVQNQTFGLIVDAVRDVESIHDEDIYEPPAQVRMEMDCLTGIAKTESVVHLLDARLFIAENGPGSPATVPSEIYDLKKKEKT